MQTVALLTSSVGAVSDSALSLVPAFNVDTAVGVQLDVIGLWVGISRSQSLPITGAWFTWNSSTRGWNVSNWKSPSDPDEGIVTLDDTTYRVVIKAKIGSNYWDGTVKDLTLIGTTAMADAEIVVFVLDNLDMTTTVYILGTPTYALIELIKRGVCPPKTAGVRITGYILASSPGAPFFALSVGTTSLVAGLDFGSFGDPV